MTRILGTLGGIVIAGAALTAARPAQTGAVQPATQIDPAPFRSVVSTYCVSCHNDALKTGGLALDKLDVGDTPAAAEIWEKVIRKLQVGMMPPQGVARPDAATTAQFVAYLQTSLDRAAAAHPNPGRVGIHRLNRSEYAYAVRDLLSLDIDVSPLLPPDDSSYGFDNIADMLGMPPALLDRYLSASLKISSMAVGGSAVDAGTTTYRVRSELSQDAHIDGLPIGTRGGLVARHYFPRDGMYEIRPRLWRTATEAVRGLEYAQALEITIDGARVHTVKFGGLEDDAKAYKDMVATGREVEARFQIRLPVTAGAHDVGVTFLRQSSGPRIELLQPFLRENADSDNQNGLSVLDGVTLAGPFDVTGPGDTASRRAIFSCHPARTAEERACATTILTALARRAYRGSVSAAQTNQLMTFFTRGRSRGSFDEGIELAVSRILVSPEFLFRLEADPPTVAAGASYRLDDTALASRLSFFLWSSIPDVELSKAVAQGALKAPGGLDAQAKRMLADPRSARFMNNFTGQWLFLRNLNAFQADSLAFPDFDDNLRDAMRTETEMFVDSIRREDRSVVDLLTADYTFVNERLARHYGMIGVHGDQFRRVPVTNDARRGLLGQASILTITSYATRTSPVIRGKWILGNLLGVPPPDPPPNVPTLNEAVNGKLSMRQRMEQHRANPVCASCHKVMDPIGFSLENFDAIGRWRTADGTAAIDPSGTLADGTAVDGAASLRRAVASHPELFVRTLVEKMMTYALGRGLEYTDMPAVRAIVQHAAQDQYRLSSIVLGIVTSPQFTMKIKTADAAPARAAH